MLHKKELEYLTMAVGKYRDTLTKISMKAETASRIPCITTGLTKAQEALLTDRSTEISVGKIMDFLIRTLNRVNPDCLDQISTDMSTADPTWIQTIRDNEDDTLIVAHLGGRSTVANFQDIASRSILRN